MDCKLTLSRATALFLGPLLGATLFAGSANGQESKAGEVVAEPVGMLSDLRLSLIPERRELAPYQPLYVKIALANGGKRDYPVPNQIRTYGIRFRMYEEGFPGRMFASLKNPFARDALVRPGEAVYAYMILYYDAYPPHPRRSPLRIFDLPARYQLRVLSSRYDVPEHTQYMSELASIRVREPSEDERIAGDLIMNKHGPRFLASAKESAHALQQFLDKYPQSVFADDFKIWLGHETRALGYSFDKETGGRRDSKLNAEAIKIWMTIDVNRPWVRRTTITEPVMRDLCNPKIQAHLNVREILNQWKVHPPHDKDDLEIASRLKLWVPFIEATLRGESVKLPDSPE
jgi:hypothetical protein